VAELNELCEKTVLAGIPVHQCGSPYWKPGDPLASLIDETQVARLQECAKEKTRLHSTLLGSDYSGDVETYFHPNKSVHGTMLNFLTPEKRNAMEELEHKYTARMLKTYKDLDAWDNESTRTVLAERDEEVSNILPRKKKVRVRTAPVRCLDDAARRLG